MSNASDFIIENGVLNKYIGPGGDVVIPDGITSVGCNAFLKCKSLQTVTIPEGVTEIGNGAFESCSNLASVSLSDSIETVGNSAFYQCSSLAGITIPKSVTQIGSSAFCGCSSLASIRIQGSVTRISESSFWSISEYAQIIAPHTSFDLFSSYIVAKRAAGVGYLCHFERYTNQVIADAYRKYVISQRKNLLPIAFSLDLVQAMAYYADNKKITASNFETEYMQPAQKANATNCVAWLLEWKNANITAKDVKKQAERELTKDPFNTADMKKLWSYESVSDGTLMITSYKGSEEEVVVPERIGKIPVTRLGDCVFGTVTKNESFKPYDRISALESIRSVHIPNGVTSIGNEAFFGCKSLTNVTIPETVTHIGKAAFRWCSELESVVIPEGIAHIGDHAFCGCKKLVDSNGFVVVCGVLYNYYGRARNVTIPEGVEKIEDEAFREYNKLKRVLLPESVAFIHEKAFAHCDALQVVAPHTPFEVLKNANLCYPAAFGYLFECKQYSDAQIVANYQTYIGAQKKKLLPLLFASDAVQAVEIYASAGKITAKNIDKDFLQPALAAKAAQCIAFLTDWKKRNGSAEDVRKQPEHKLNNDIQDAEKAKKDLLNVADMKKIWSFESLDDGSLCITNYKGNDTQLIIPERIGKKMVSAIADEAFSCYKFGRSEKQKEVLKRITSVTIQDGIRHIGKQAFYGCENLTSVSVPSSITHFGDQAFYSCKKLADKDGFVIVGNVLFQYRGDQKDVVVPNSVTSIGAFAFQFSGITSINIPDSITSIGTGAFSSCDGLADKDSFVIVRNVLYRYCGNSNSIIIPNGIVSIGDSAFCRSRSITDVTIPDSVTNIENHAFNECTELKSIIIPDSVNGIGDYAFEKCKKLKKIVLSSNLTHIGSGAFWECDNLTSIRIPDSVTTIDRSAFWHCKKLLIHVPAGSYAETYAKENNIPFVAE